MGCPLRCTCIAARQQAHDGNTATHHFFQNELIAAIEAIFGQGQPTESIPGEHIHAPEINDQITWKSIEG